MENNTKSESAAAISVICFTDQGEMLCRQVVACLYQNGIPARGYRKGSNLGREAPAEPYCTLDVPAKITRIQESLETWTKEQFRLANGMIFIGAAGIAVRAVSQWVQDKFSDPPVVVMDEKGQFAIPILSGHVGLANDLARLLGREMGAMPVITTATDVQGCFAVDVFARKRGLWISSRSLAKETSAALLAGEKVGFFSDFPIAGDVPDGCVLEQRCRRNIAVSVNVPTEEGTLCLVPKAVTLGIGCRRGIRADQIQEGVFRFLEQNRIFVQAVAQAASIDVKQKEEGLSSFCQQMGWKLDFFSARELKGLAGAFSHSDFVEKTVGVGNVCERAAVLGSGGKFEQLIQKKEQFDGVTVAAALSDWKVIM